MSDQLEKNLDMAMWAASSFFDKGIDFIPVPVSESTPRGMLFDMANKAMDELHILQEEKKTKDK